MNGGRPSRMRRRERRGMREGGCQRLYNTRRRLRLMYWKATEVMKIMERTGLNGPKAREKFEEEGYKLWEVR